METASGSDKSIGFGFLFAVVGVVGALVLLAGGFQYGASHDHFFQLVAAWGFAIAMIGGALAIAAIHLYE
ncbi:MAG: hypothetical protein ABEJ06_00560 [Haloarculaceae archaeon]